MILINLLPHREAARKRRSDVFNASLIASALLGAVIAVAVYLWFQAAISEQQGTNQALQTEITKLEGQIKEISGLEAEIAALRARQKAVEDLQSDRNLPVHLLSELVNQLPDGVYVAKMTQVDQQVTINGVAQSNERVSELLRNLSSNTPWFTKPELVEIVSGNLALTPRDQRRVANFVIRVQLVRANEAEKAAKAMPAAATASAPVVAASIPVAAASAAIQN